MKSILIGCPVYKRDWVLKDWFKYIENQNYPLSKLGFIFELGEDDEATEQVLYDWHEAHPEVSVFDGVIRADLNHATHKDGQRHWSGEKYEVMVELRNSLLERASCYDFDCYFSLDSDILLENPDTLMFLSEATEYYDVVSPLSYMTPYDTDYPSVMWWQDEPGFEAYRDKSRVKLGSFFQADIVMAAKMMSKEVYRTTRYIWHRQGEDLGFARSLHKRGFRSYCASNIYAFHAMHKHTLAEYKRAGFDSRNPNIQLTESISV
jgi:hypothetical protein